MPTRYSIQQLVAQADATLEDNITQSISSADVRNMVKNFLATMKPSQASMIRNTNLVLALTPTPTVIAPYSVVRISDAPESVPTLATGKILRAVTSLGNAKVTSRLTFFIGVSGTAGAELTFTLYANGSATDVVGRISTSGTGNVVNAVLSALVDATVDTDYDIRVSSSNNANYTFTNGIYRMENVPVAI